MRFLLQRRWPIGLRAFVGSFAHTITSRALTTLETFTPSFLFLNRVTPGGSLPRLARSFRLWARIPLRRGRAVYRETVGLCRRPSRQPATSVIRPPWNGAIVCTSSFSRWMLSYSATAYGTAVTTSGVVGVAGGEYASGSARIFSPSADRRPACRRCARSSSAGAARRSACRR